MARAGLGWGLRELAQRSGIGIATVNRFELGHMDPRHETMRAVEATFEAAGVTFLAAADGGVGVLLTPKAPLSPS